MLAGMHIVTFKGRQAPSDLRIEESTMHLKDHILGNAVLGAVGVYTTLCMGPDKGQSAARKQDLVELHTTRLVRCIAPIISKDGIESAQMSLYNDVRDCMIRCLDAVEMIMMADSPANMVVIVIWVAQAAASLEIEQMIVYVKEYTPRSIDGPNVAYILGPPRKNPDIKDVLWMRDRGYLEQLAPPGAADVLLCTNKGELLEGLVTNLFVVVERGDGSTVVQTAPVDSGVLWGTMRKQVIDACRYLSITIEYICPSIDERQTWKEAFLTNSMRGVSSLHGIACGRENVWGLPEWHVSFGTPSIAPQIAQYLNIW